MSSNNLNNRIDDADDIYDLHNDPEYGLKKLHETNNASESVWNAQTKSNKTTDWAGCIVWITRFTFDWRHKVCNAVLHIQRSQFIMGHTYIYLFFHQIIIVLIVNCCYFAKCMPFAYFMQFATSSPIVNAMDLWTLRKRNNVNSLPCITLSGMTLMDDGRLLFFSNEFQMKCQRNWRDINESQWDKWQKCNTKLSGWSTLSYIKATVDPTLSL